jgi:hypothetical protein
MRPTAALCAFLIKCPSIAANMGVALGCDPGYASLIPSASQASLTASSLTLKGPISASVPRVSHAASEHQNQSSIRSITLKRGKPVLGNSTPHCERTIRKEILQRSQRRFVRALPRNDALIEGTVSTR